MSITIKVPVLPMPALKRKRKAFLKNYYYKENDHWFLCLMVYQPSWVILMSTKSSWYYLIQNSEDKGIYTFSHGR